MESVPVKQAMLYHHSAIYIIYVYAGHCKCFGQIKQLGYTFGSSLSRNIWLSSWFEMAVLGSRLLMLVA